jgi:preprotein translocase subunit Sec61beta
MASSRMTINQPQSQAGILGITSGTNMGGWKFNPRGVVVFSILFVIVVKILDFLVAQGRL